MSTQTRLQPSRRTVLRAAAWTAPAVSIAVAAPAFASHSGPHGSGSAGPLTINRAGTVLKLATNFTADQPLTGVTAVVTLTYIGSNDTSVTSTAIAQPWTKSASNATSATFTAATLPSGVTAFRPELDLNNTSFDSVQITVTFTWAGGPATTSATYSKDKSNP